MEVSYFVPTPPAWRKSAPVILLWKRGSISVVQARVRCHDVFWMLLGTRNGVAKLEQFRFKLRL